MGYTTYFSGSVQVCPALSPEESRFLVDFSRTRHCRREEGLYYTRPDAEDINGGGTILDGNTPEQGEPSIWCQWIPTEEGDGIEWDGGEKFYSADKWMAFLIEHFLKPDCRAKQADPTRFAFLQGHNCSGEIFAAGEDGDDFWKIFVEDNKVFTYGGYIGYHKAGFRVSI